MVYLCLVSEASRPVAITKGIVLCGGICVQSRTRTTKAWAVDEGMGTCEVDLAEMVMQAFEVAIEAIAYK